MSVEALVNDPEVRWRAQNGTGKSWVETDSGLSRCS